MSKPLPPPPPAGAGGAGKGPTPQTLQAGPGAGDKLLQMAGERTEYTWNDFKNYYVNDGPKAICIALFVLINMALAAERGVAYFQDPGKLRFTQNVGYGVPIARMAAAALKFDCALILFTVMRNFLSFLRTTCVNKFLPIDKNIVFHKGIAWTIAFWAAVHMGAHYFNYYSIATSDANPIDLKNLLPFLNVYTSRGQIWPTPFDLAFKLNPGITGHCLILIMCMMFTTSIVSIRRPFFEMFWYTHHCFILFFGVLIAHGFPGVLEPPNFWMWFIAPGVCYALERCVRVIRGNEDTVLGMAIQHPSKVLELRMKKATMTYVPGQYLFLNCPTLSLHEWHPFTITSAPEEDFVSVHIRVVGDWTGALQKLLNNGNRMGVVAQDITTAADGRAILKIDGPFGAASEEVFDYSTVMLCAAGIGVTPFASILKSVRYRLERQKATGIFQMSLKKVYFFWISRDREAFEWFVELLAALEKDNIDNFLEINTYLTGELKPHEIRSVMYGDDDGRDAVTGLQSSTHYGRPEWGKIFDQMAVKHQGEKIGVFFCGPAPLSKALYKESRVHTMNDKYGTKFHFNKENF